MFAQIAIHLGETMFQRIVKDIKSTPNRLREAPQKLTARRHELVRNLRNQAQRVRGDGQEAIWNFQTQTLERVDALLDRAGDVPGVSRVVESAERVVEQRLATVTAVPVDSYETMNVKQVCRAIRSLDRVALLKIRRFEELNKNRKTVLDAVERRWESLLEQPIQDAA